MRARIPDKIRINLDIPKGMVVCIDNLVHKGKYKSRASFIRRSCVKLLLCEGEVLHFKGKHFEE